MSKTRRWVLQVLAIMFAVGAADAWALAGFSRACNFNSLSSSTKDAYYGLTRHTLFGVPVNQASPAVQQSLWALESLTTDYGEFRFFLLAYSGQYVNDVLTDVFQSTWRADSLFDNNRQLAFSARAGRDFKFLFPDETNGLFAFLTPDPRQVTGVHYYYDRKIRQFVFLGITKVTNDCNCVDWGLEFSWASVAAAVLACSVL